MIRGCPSTTPIRILLVILALLVCNTAGGLARRLAGGLALAASAGLGGLCNILGFYSLDSFHCSFLRIKF